MLGEWPVTIGIADKGSQNGIFEEENAAQMNSTGEKRHSIEPTLLIRRHQYEE